MSTGERMPLTQAYDLAAVLAGLLEPACELVTIAGSVRRQVETVGDLELVAIPRMGQSRQVGLFGGGGRPVSRLWELVDQLVVDPLVELRRHPDIEVTPGGTRAAPWGDRYRKLLWQDVPVDLFTADQDSLGAILLLRTGPSGYSRAWVSALRPAGLLMRGGFVRSLHTDEIVSVPSEHHAHRLVSWRYLEPEERQGWKGTASWSGRSGVVGR